MEVSLELCCFVFVWAMYFEAATTGAICLKRERFDGGPCVSVCACRLTTALSSVYAAHVSGTALGIICCNTEMAMLPSRMAMLP